MTADIKEFVPPWLDAYLDTLEESESKDFLSKYEGAVHEALEQLQSLPVNAHSDGTEEGHYSVRLGNTNKFLNLNKAVWTTAKYAGPLIMAAAISPALLAHLGLTAAMMPHITLGTSGSAVAAICGAFSRLDSAELDTYQAVVAAIERNKNRVLGNSGADIREIRESFKRDRDLFPPKDLEPMLEQLEKKLVLKKEVIGGVQQYFVAF